MLGIEIRVKVLDYVKDRIEALRAQNPGQYTNISCIRSNAMKYLPNFFQKGQVLPVNWFPHSLGIKKLFEILSEIRCSLDEYFQIMHRKRMDEKLKLIWLYKLQNGEFCVAHQLLCVK